MSSGIMRRMLIFKGFWPTVGITGIYVVCITVLPHFYREGGLGHPQPIDYQSLTQVKKWPFFRCIKPRVGVYLRSREGETSPRQMFPKKCS